MSLILVTGGCGFIGANLIPILEPKGHQVQVLDNLSRGNKQYLKNTSAKIIEGDIRDGDIVAEALEGVDGVIHLAAYGSVVESVGSPEENFDINAKGTFNVLNECRKKGIKKFVFASTGGALIGNAEPPVNEDSLPHPISPYGSSKLCGEAYCSSFSSAYDMDIIALRFANVIGPYSQHKKGAVTAFIQAVNKNRPIIIYGDGSATRDFLFVGDLCLGISDAFDRDIKGFTQIHLSSGRDVSIKELAQETIKIMNQKDHPIEYVDKRVGEVERNFANYDKAKSLLDFSPTINLSEAIKMTLESFEIDC